MSVSGKETRAASVAKLTVAVTPSSRFSFRSTRAAQDAQVMPPMTRSVVLVVLTQTERPAADPSACAGGAQPTRLLTL